MKTVIVDERISDKCERSLALHGFRVLRLPADSHLGGAVASHPDTVLFYADSEIITTAEYCDDAAYFFTDLRQMHPHIKITFTSEQRSPLYPRDCIMNALAVGGNIFCKSDTVSEKIKEFASERDLRIIHTRQGYPACTVLSLCDYAITADRGMAATLSENGIAVTLIREGHILLDSHEYGFIGGASGVFSDKVYFFGDILSHPDGELICEAIRRAGYTPISLSDEPLCDLGGMIFLQDDCYSNANERNE